MPFCPDCKHILLFLEETDEGDLWYCPYENRRGIAVYTETSPQGGPPPMTAPRRPCAACGMPFQPGQNIYEVKLMDGQIVLSHGYPCCDRLPAKVPIVAGDWWIREAPRQ